jgi:hypothetical protein
MLHIQRQHNKTHQTLKKGGSRTGENRNIMEGVNLFNVQVHMYGIIKMKFHCIINVCKLKYNKTIKNKTELK